MFGFILLLVLLFLSAFLSSAEMAFVSANKLKIEVKSRKNNIKAKSINYFVKNPHKFFSTILIGINIVNVAFASVSALILKNIFHLSDLSILIATTSILFLLGELIPKYFARELADSFILLAALPLRIISFVLYPFVQITSWISSFITQFSKISDSGLIELFDKKEFQKLIDESQEAGKVNKDESELINKLIDLSDQRIHEAMQPRTEIVAVEINSSVEEALNKFIESGYSKLPVYEESIDNILGIIYAYDFFKEPKTIKEIIKDVMFIPESKKSFEVLKELLDNHVSIAVVIDEFGGTAGIVTVEDIIEELFGEIEDEYDIEEDICRKVSENSYLINGRTEIDYLRDKYNIEIPEGDYETIAGYILAETGKIPKQGDTFTIDNFNILILKASNNKIELVKLTIQNA